jgi:hypothetical protein
MEEALTVHFTSVFGQPGEGGLAVDYGSLGFAPADLSALDTPISMEEVWAAIKDMPPDRAPGPDGFTGAFYRSAWEVIKEDIMAGINCVLYGDSRAFHLLNNVLIVLWLHGQLYVCRPKELGGLGVPDLKLTSIALQTKWLWLQHTDTQRAWSQLPSKLRRRFRRSSTPGPTPYSGMERPHTFGQEDGSTVAPSRTSH